MGPNMKPTINEPRKLPFALKQRLKQDLQRMIQLDIIGPVNKPTVWVSFLVSLEKPNGNLRICLDTRNLNKAINTELYEQLGQIFQEMVRAQYFTNASNDFW